MISLFLFSDEVRIHMADLEEYELWDYYPEHRKWFNKLWLSEQLGYYCGPCGYAPKKTKEYIVRPIYNLAGMGLGATIQKITAHDRSIVPPGSFWCEIFTDTHYSCTYTWKFDHWTGLQSWEGYCDPTNLTKFTLWKKSDYFPKVPQLFNELQNVESINIEFKGDNPIEVHLRPSGNPDGSVGYCTYSEFIPVWSDDLEITHDYISRGYSYIENKETADNFLEIYRAGFLVK